MLIDACWACANGLHAECYAPVAIENEPTEANEGSYIIGMSCCCGLSTRAEALEAVERNGVGRPMLEPGDITDIKSTGRKRAAMLAPIFDGMKCEWSRLRNAGGGVQPIVGCSGATLADRKGSGDRHHGPDKNVLNNSVGVNLHRICVNCHHRWHALNDPYYAAERPEADMQYLPKDEFTSFAHDPNTLASDEDVENSEAYWHLRTEKRGEYPFPTSS